MAWQQLARRGCWGAATRPAASRPLIVPFNITQVATPGQCAALTESKPLCALGTFLYDPRSGECECCRGAPLSALGCALLCYAPR